MNANMPKTPHNTQLYRPSNRSNLKSYSKSIYILKRLVDYISVFLLGLLSLPIIVLVVSRIKKESPGPIFFKQTRIGLYGKPFTCYKFRSMHIHTPTEDGLYTKDQDLRIFPFGQIMRKTRIDELPQIINIIKGEMHLIGPRAEWDVLVSQYEKEVEEYHNRHLVRPGITGLAQVCYPYGRNIYDTKQKLGYDLKYIKNWSLFIELKVILQTIDVVLRRKGI